MNIQKAINYNKKRDYPDSVVKKIQKFLNLPETGEWDETLIVKIKDWQKEVGFKGKSIDGAVGPVTYKKMNYFWEDAPSIKKGNVALRKAMEKNRHIPLFLCPITWEKKDLGSIKGVEWVLKIQEALALSRDGIFGEKTRNSFEKRYGPLSLSKNTLKPVPLFVHRWGYDHAHSWDDLSWPYKDSKWEERTSPVTWENGMLRLVSGYHPSTGRTNRPGNSYITLDTYSISFSHWWSKEAPNELSKIAKEIPNIMKSAFGGDISAKLKKPKWLLETIPPFSGKKGRVTQDYRNNWLASGWWWMGSLPETLNVTQKLWFDSYVKQGLNMAISFGWSGDLIKEDGNKILAACVRLANSGSGSGRKRIRKALEDTDNSPMKVLEKTYITSKKEGGYGKPKRWDKITSWDYFEGPVDKNILKKS